MCFKSLQLSRRTTTDYSRYEHAGMPLMAENGRSTSDVELVISVKASLLYLSKIIFLVMD